MFVTTTAIRALCKSYSNAQIAAAIDLTNVYLVVILRVAWNTDKESSIALMRINTFWIGRKVFLKFKFNLYTFLKFGRRSFIARSCGPGK